MSRHRARLDFTAALAVASALLFTPAFAQQPPAGGMTIMASPPDARLILTGSTEIAGVAPLDLGPQWTGRYSVSIEAPGYAAARGALEFPAPGSRPVARSQPPGISGGLFLRSLNFPGVPDLMSRHTGRGIAFLTAGVGGAAAVLRDHIEYRSNVKNLDAESRDRAFDFRYARGRWALYTGAVWGMSALDYIVQARMDLLEATPNRVSVGAPKLTRGAVLWRSALVPGAGQDYANRRGRGLFWLAATLASGAAYFIADESHHRIVTKLARADTLLLTAPPADVPDRQADVDHFLSLEETSRQLVNGLAIGTLALYVANVIDAGIVPLGGGPKARKFSLSAPVNARHAEVALTYRF